MDPTMVLVITVAFIGGVIVLIFLTMRSQQKAQARFFDKLGGLGSSGSGTRRELSYSGRRIITGFHPGSKNTPPRFSLRAEVASPGNFSLTPQGSGEALMQKLGLETDVETGDPQFDARYDIDSDDNDFAAAYFASAKKREAVYALFALGCCAIRLEEAGLRADWVPFAIKADTSTEFVGSALPHLAALCEDLPAPPPVRSAGGVRQKTFHLAAGAFLFLTIALFMVFSFFSSRLNPLDIWELFKASLRYSVPAYLSFVLLIAAVLKGKSWFLAGLLQCAGIGLFLFPLAGYWGMAWLNVSRDQNTPAVHRVQVTGKSSHRGKNSTTYYVRLNSWRHPGGSERLTVSHAVFQQTVPGQSLALVETKPGHLGYEFVTKLDIRFSPPGGQAP